MTYRGYECLTVSGVVQNPGDKPFQHAWNLIKIEGQWHLVDVTTGINGYKPVFHEPHDAYREISDAEKVFDRYRYQFDFPNVV